MRSRPTWHLESSETPVAVEDLTLTLQMSFQGFSDRNSERRSYNRRTNDRAFQLIDVVGLSIYITGSDTWADVNAHVHVALAYAACFKLEFGFYMCKVSSSKVQNDHLS